MANFLYVDNSNVWIEGQHVAAVTSGLAPDIWTALEYRICDHNWRLDFGRLMEFAGGDKAQIGRAVLYGSRPPPNDSLWGAAKAKGFEVFVHDRSHWTGKEKKVDTQIATDITADSYELMDPKRDEITLVAGDSDYVPTVERLRKRGLRFDVCFWGQASAELRQACSNFVALDDHLELVRFR
ncbi:MAG: NYN domain-containing protein, partial [Gammaproteobacteria bacterium]